MPAKAEAGYVRPPHRVGLGLPVLGNHRLTIHAFFAPARSWLCIYVFSVFRNCEATLRLAFEFEFEQIWRQMHILKH